MIRGRRPASDDNPILRLIRQELIPLNPPHLRPRWSKREILRRVDRGTTFVWVPDGKPYAPAAGFLTAVVRGDELFVDMLAMDRAFQGSGAGGELLRRAEKHGVDRGCRVMRLYVNDDNARGIRFYRKHGMAPVWYESGIQSYVMEKRIG
ncbi:GNAT family N-acetyltransferase [Paenibacillus sp.]|uniref:GNAT family N-acetyltransferase n=1 Tax=Paenibacillus sp. TaxID=58172 RepID=UPI0028115C0A|nr:GNAT family N-acetyltransferase [Paenibacillus sp.]